MGTDIRGGRSACRQYEALLEDYVNGRLDKGSTNRVAEHLGGCEVCRRAFDDAAASVRLLRAVGPLISKSPKPGPEFSRLVMARIRVESDRRVAEGLGFWQPFVSMAWRLAATAMVVLVILLTYATRGNNSPQPQVASVSQPALTDVFAPDPTRAPANQDEVLIMVADEEHGNH
jgi:Putative zinc-finger